MHRAAQPIIAAALVLAVAGEPEVAGDEPVPAKIDPTRLDGTWRLEELVLDGGTQPAGAAEVDLHGGRLFASRGCNDISATYRVVNGQLVVSDALTTDVFCPGQPLEEAYLDVLLDGGAVSVDGDALTITSAQAHVRLKLVSRFREQPEGID